MKNTTMNVVPRDASDEQVLGIVRGWVDVLARKAYAEVFEEIGLLIRGTAPGPECIQGCIEYYRSPDYYPGVENFVVTDWRTAYGGNPEPMQKVEWYDTSRIAMAGAVSFDLPLNGRWSDLTADFVFFENDDPEGYCLYLEEINSWEQGQRESWEQDQRDLASLETHYKNYDKGINLSDEDYSAFVKWLSELTASELYIAKGQPEKQKQILCRYYKRGGRANLTTGELVDFLGVSSPSIFDMAGYTEEEVDATMQISDGLTDDDLDRVLLPNVA